MAMEQVLLLLVVCMVMSGAYAQTFQHPGALVSQAQLDFMKKQVLAQAEPQYEAYQKALKSKWGNLNYKAEGPPSNGVMDCGSDDNPNIGCTDDDDDGTAAFLQSLLWYITGNKQYATNCINLFNTYANGLKKIENMNAPLQAGWSAMKWAKAAEVIRHTNAGWSEDGIDAMAKLFATVHLPLIYNGSTFNGNWELAMIDGMFSISVFTEDWDLFNHAATFWKQRVPAYMYYEPLDGNKPVKAPRGDPSWYGETVFNASVNGIAQETCRDLGHTQLGMTSAIYAAETARIQGLDLYGSEAPRIMAAMEFNTNLLLGAKPPPYICGTGKVTLLNVPTWEVAYNEYHNRSGYTLPNTWKQIVTNVRPMPELANMLTDVWETLTHGDSS